MPRDEVRETCLISIMLANNEIGTINPVNDIAEAFPDLPWRESWPTFEQRSLALRYTRRRAAQLLALQHLPGSYRERLELAARKDPLQVEMLWRLYPRIVNRSILIGARVEAQVRLAGS